eukprot:1934843-Rhodomonas_salina.3
MSLTLVIQMLCHGAATRACEPWAGLKRCITMMIIVATVTTRSAALPKRSTGWPHSTPLN